MPAPPPALPTWSMRLPTARKLERPTGARGVEPDTRVLRDRRADPAALDHERHGHPCDDPDALGVRRVAAHLDPADDDAMARATLEVLRSDAAAHPHVLDGDVQSRAVVIDGDLAQDRAMRPTLAAQGQALADVGGLVDDLIYEHDGRASIHPLDAFVEPLVAGVGTGGAGVADGFGRRGGGHRDQAGRHDGGEQGHGHRPLDDAHVCIPWVGRVGARHGRSDGDTSGLPEPSSQPSHQTYDVGQCADRAPKATAPSPSRRRPRPAPKSPAPKAAPAPKPRQRRRPRPAALRPRAPKGRALRPRAATAPAPCVLRLSSAEGRVPRPSSGGARLRSWAVLPRPPAAARPVAPASVTGSPATT